MRKALLLGFAAGLMLLASQAMANAYCAAPPTCTDNGGFIGSISTFDTNYISLLMSTNNGFDVLVDQDTVIGRTPHHIWADVTLGSASLSANIGVNFTGYDFYLGTKKINRTVEVSDLTLIKTDLNTGVSLSFAGSDNNISLTESTINFSSQDPVFSTSAPLTINALSGTNRFTSFEGNIDSLSTAINVSSGATLDFYLAGSLGSTGTPLYFRSAVTGLVDGGTLSFDRSNVRFNSSSFTFQNSATLSLSQSNTTATFDYLSLDNSQANLDNNTSLVATDATLSNATLSFNSGALFSADILRVTGDTTISGSESVGSGVDAGIGLFSANTTYTQNSSLSSFNRLYLYDGTDVEINDGTFTVHTVYADPHAATVADINVNSGGTQSITGGVHPSNRLVDITVANCGLLNVD
ncbi:MAG: hypothetical protein ABW116_15290 [Candidatus Sedimenticola sp. 20ELBAFRAG]